MAAEVLKDHELDGLRKIGDPDFEHAVLGDAFSDTRSKGFLEAAAGLAPAAVPHIPTTLVIDEDKVRVANALFGRYGTEIAGALLLAALPQAYAARWGSRVLAATARLQNDFRRRIVRTAQFVLLVTRAPQGYETGVSDLWAPNGAALQVGRASETTPPWLACVAVRRFHESVRQTIQSDEPLKKAVGRENEIPLNQEDLLGTLLSFTVTVFEVLERYGISWTADEQEAYLHLWDLVGERLGTGTPAVREQLPPDLKQKLDDERWIGLRPPTVRQTRRLFDQLRHRQWPPPAAIVPDVGNTADVKPDCVAGRVLVRALLNELAAAMPTGTRALPLAVMRQLADGVIRDRLALGGGGIVMSMLDLMPKREVLVDRFTVLHAPSGVGGTALRSMANEVTRRAVLRFIRNEDLFIPGLKMWSGGLRDPMEVGIA
jgi:hypothetical protein